MELKPYIKPKRRAKGLELVTFTVSLPEELVDQLDDSGISSQRGAGNLSIFLELSALIALGLFKDPVMAEQALSRMIRRDDFAPVKASKLAENLEEVVKLLVD